MLHLAPLTIDHKTVLDYHAQMIKKNALTDAMQITGIPALEDNYVWIITQGNTTLVIDPSEGAPIIDWLEKQQRVPSAILITHNHHDHIGGITALQKDYDNLPVYAHQKTKLAFTTHPLASDAYLKIGDIELQILDLSGHTPDQIGYYLPQAKALFCGDALFSGGCGRLFNGGTAAQMTATLARITALAADTRIYCAHEYTLANLRFAHICEPENHATNERLQKTIVSRRQGLATVPSLLYDELATNPFLRTETPALHQAIDATAGFQTTHAIERFTQLRAWKDRLDATGILEIAA
jgi:hydroxyacylglutathione hydrolase